MNEQERELYLFLLMCGREDEAVKFREACYAKKHEAQKGGSNG